MDKDVSDLKTVIGQLIEENNLHYCLECGKCSAVCPMLDFYGEYAYDRSPRGIVEQLSLDPESIEGEALWYCLTCRECTFYCPSGINFQRFMMALRDSLLARGHTKFAMFCPICKSYTMPKKEFEYLLKGTDLEKARDLLEVCPQCKKADYVKTLHRTAR
ncbi:MAG: 4Fe-4S dicluster domain-containing protein [Deltaproteobacteria bacterium]|nr:4Fe-4S dicluster domain-containing protein [Deltaproteobacteria bacterium]MBW2207203.1 4Fe-4S dicluster domain-containing protein [Deltaproteobacteria bacterium]